MKKLDFYWKSNKNWYHRQEENGACVINKDAPLEAQNSYKHYLEQCKEIEEKRASISSTD